jgi:Flp pilus assembly pilin Flp
VKANFSYFIRFIWSKRSEKGQDFPEYALILGTVAVVALAVLAPLRQAIITAFNFAISALQAAVGG